MTVRRSMAYVGVVALACVPLTWLTRAVIDAREAARSAQCMSNLKQIGLGLLNYESRYGCFPPAYVADANGKPLYSWRVVLMAEIDRTDRWFGGQLADGFHFDEPWDSPNNSKLHKLTPYTVWHCPSDQAIAGSNETNFVAVVGPGTMFASDGTSRRLADVTDGPENTLIVVEVVDAGIHWMEPKELDWRTMSFRLNDGTRPSISSNHPFRGSSNLGANVLTVNDMVTKIPPNLQRFPLGFKSLSSKDISCTGFAMISIVRCAVVTVLLAITCGLAFRLVHYEHPVFLSILALSTEQVGDLHELQLLTESDIATRG